MRSYGVPDKTVGVKVDVYEGFECTECEKVQDTKE